MITSGTVVRNFCDYYAGFSDLVRRFYALSP